jgi:hypothetical protein
MFQKVVYTTLLFLAIGANAQTGCGTPWDNGWAEEMLLRDRSYLNKHVSSRDIIYIPIHYHIVKDNNGANGFPLTYLLQMHCELNERYTPVGIQFYIKDITSLNDNSVFDFTTSDLGVDGPFFATQNTKSACNVYLVKNPAGNCGYTYRPAVITSNNGGIFVSASRTSTTCSGPGATTLTHEMGHWLDLPHTFYGWEGQPTPTNTTNAPTNIGGWSKVEKVSRTTGANCSNSGDFFCGTPPDYISSRWTCPSGTGTSYKDPVGATFVHDGGYYMSYSNDNCQSKFSTDQINQMNYAMKNISQRKEILNVAVPASVDYTPTTAVFPANGYKIPRNKVQLTWAQSPEAPMYHVIMIKGTGVINNSPNFDLLQNVLLDTIVSDTSILVNQNIFPVNAVQSNNYFYWKVKPMSYRNPCVSYSNIGNFKVSNMSANISIIKPTCPGGKDGKATFVVSGASTASISYNLDAIGATTDVISDLGNGEYLMTITGASTSEVMQIVFKIEDPMEIDPGFKVNLNYSLSTAPSNGTAPYTYQWSTGATSPTITIQNQTSYTVTITDAKGCVSTKTIAIGFVGIEILEGENIALLPSIAKAGSEMILSINTNSKGAGNLEMFNAIGEKVFTQNINFKAGQNQYPINTSLTAGTYVIQVSGEKIAGVKRTIIF